MFAPGRPFHLTHICTGKTYYDVATIMVVKSFTIQALPVTFIVALSLMLFPIDLYDQFSGAENVPLWFI